MLQYVKNHLFHLPVPGFLNAMSLSTMKWSSYELLFVPVLGSGALSVGGSIRRLPLFGGLPGLHFGTSLIKAAQIPESFGF